MKLHLNAIFNAKRVHEYLILYLIDAFSTLCHVTYDIITPLPLAGFTALTEKYTLSGRGGTDKLTETLNSYIGALVECILRRDGDVLQFAGQSVIMILRFSGSVTFRADLVPHFVATVASFRRVADEK